MNLDVVAEKQQFNSVGHCVETSAKGVGRIFQGLGFFASGVIGVVGNGIIYIAVGIARISGGKTTQSDRKNSKKGE